MTKQEQIMEAYRVSLSYSIERDVPLLAYSTFRIGGNADWAAWPDSVDSLCEFISFLQGVGLRYLIVGNGSNFLFDDEGFRGVVIFTSRIRNISLEKNTVIADCGTPLASLAREAQKAGLTGLEFVHGIPGSVGGAVFMNAGAYGGQISDVMTDARVLNMASGKIRIVSARDFDFGYRTGMLQKGEDVLLSARFTLNYGNPIEIRAVMDDLMHRRIEKQPLDYPSAGSVFRRPEGYFAGQLIEQAGLKGKRIGGACVSEKHAGFIINEGGATSQDVRKLISLIQAQVKEQFGVTLETEIRYQEP